MAKVAKKVIKKRRDKKNIPNGQVHIRATFNNTIVTVTDTEGNAISITDKIAFFEHANAHYSKKYRKSVYELLLKFHSENEVSEIWITFPDPQMKKVRKRLTSTAFMERYQQIMKENGIIHLKTDSPFLRI